MLVADNESKTRTAGTDDRETIARMTGPPARGVRTSSRNRLRPGSAYTPLDRIMALLSDHRAEICDAMAADYVVRAPEQTMLADVVAVVGRSPACEEASARWMKSARLPARAAGGEDHVHYHRGGCTSCRGIFRSA